MKLQLKLPLLLFLLPLPLLPQSPGQKTYCNPMDINYRYNFEQLNENISYRSGADPVIVNHRGEYYLFVTISGGWWHSKDLLHWNYVVPDKWPMEDMCAPAALSVRDTLYLFQSTFDLRPIFFTTTPWTGHLKFFNRLLPALRGATGPWDPAIFHDEDMDKWYMYWGSSNVFPIYGIELDHGKRLTYIDTAKALFYLDPVEHGWERFGRDHRDTIKPFVEGAWMTKFKNRYYLQYGAPGTEYNVYANGTYVGDHPLGPFTYASYNPVSYKPGGFMTGAGHGNTFQDNYGNYWNTGTPWIAVNWNFERRIAMFPAGFDTDGQMFSIRYEHVYVAACNLAISDIRVFGTAPGKPPATPGNLIARRDSDPGNVFISWKPVQGATGYNVLWGIRPDKLYQTYQRFSDQEIPLEIRALNKGQDYYFAIEAFNENGVSIVSKPVHIE